MKLSDIFRILPLAIFISFSASLAMAENPLEGKRLVVVGDSYVRNHTRPWSESWHSKAAERLKMYYFNFGRNGNCIAFDRSERGFGAPLTERYKEMPKEADYILIIAGHNDAFEIGNKPGHTLDSVATSLNSLIQSLRGAYPQAKIGYVLPWAVDRANFKEVREMIQKVCPKYGVPVLDVDATGAIKVNDPEFREQYFQKPNDTAHLNAKGHDLVVPICVEFLKSL